MSTPVSCFTVGPDVHRRLAAEAHGPAAAAARLADLARINALAAIVSARHGWLGSCFSAAEILATLYFGLPSDRVVLSKGHAAALQYACLHGTGRLSRAALLAYKDGPGAPQAHADRSTPGILLDSGSLGQVPSQAAALAVSAPHEPLFVVLGDGEFQEGQVFEALQTIAHRRLRNLVLVVDANGFQTERRVPATKGIPDLAGVAEGLGFSVREVDGHEPAALLPALSESAPRPRFVVARTRKGAGSEHLRPVGDRQPWHGRVPDPQLYRTILREIVDRVGDGALARDHATWSASRDAGAPRAVPATPGPSPSSGTSRKPSHTGGPSSPPSTRDAWGEALVELARRHACLAVLDADLAGPCGLEPFTRDPRVWPEGERFFEMGISEQDMVSFAGGLALAGRLPVVHTYAAFFKRAAEQIHVNQSMGARVIYAGHYGGLCYHTDGRTHQSLGDLQLFATFWDLLRVEPVTPAQTRAALAWAVEHAPGSVYFRLRRTPQSLALPAPDAQPLAPLVVRPEAPRCFVTSGTVATALALECLQRPAFRDWGLVVCVAWGPGAPGLAPHVAHREQVLVVEESTPPGPTWVAVLEASRSPEGGAGPRLDRLLPDRWGASFRTLRDCRVHFGFTVEAVEARLGGSRYRPEQEPGS